jgi:hypothetical protein
MARIQEIELRARALTLGGTAACDICGVLLSWKLPLDSEDALATLDARVLALCCPRCAGPVEIHEGSLVSEVEIATISPGGPEPCSTEIVLACHGGNDADHA